MDSKVCGRRINPLTVAFPLWSEDVIASTRLATFGEGMNLVDE